MKSPRTVVPLAWLACMLATLSHAQNPQPNDIRACTAIASDALRLACYDQASGRVNLPVAHKRTDIHSLAPGVFSRDTHVTPAATLAGDGVQPLSLLDSRWELSRESKLGTFNIRGYKPVYFLPFFASSNQNRLPHSPNPDNTVQQSMPLQNIESKFQLSLKTKVWQGVFGNAGDLWVA